MSFSKRGSSPLVDRSQWPAGPWDKELDYECWVYMGLEAFVFRHSHFGHLCGYLSVPPTHPWWGKGYDDVRSEDEDWIDVHGGLTYAQKANSHFSEAVGVDEEGWVFGFDCAHSGDLSPGMMKHRGEILEQLQQLTLPHHSLPYDVYRSLDYVRWETNKLAHQAYLAWAKEQSHG